MDADNALETRLSAHWASVWSYFSRKTTFPKSCPHLTCRSYPLKHGFSRRKSKNAINDFDMQHSAAELKKKYWLSFCHAFSLISKKEASASTPRAGRAPAATREPFWEWELPCIFKSDRIPFDGTRQGGDAAIFNTAVLEKLQFRQRRSPHAWHRSTRGFTCVHDLQQWPAVKIQAQKTPHDHDQRWKKVEWTFSYACMCS